MSNSIWSKKTKPEYLGFPAVCLLLAVTTTRPAAGADTQVHSASADETSNIAKDTADLAGAISNYYGAYQAFAAVEQWLVGGQQLTLSDIQTAIASLGTGISWKVNTLPLSTFDGDFKAAIQQAIDCQKYGNCDIFSTVQDVNSSTQSDLLSFTDSKLGLATFTRTPDDSLIQGFWMYAITDRPPVENGVVYDWREAMPYFLKWLGQRLAFMEAVDPQGFPADFSYEISQYISMLQTHRDRMRDGIRCGLARVQDWQNANNLCCEMDDSPAPGGCFSNPAAIDVYYNWDYFCADIYSGTYAVRVLGPAGCGPGSWLMPAPDMTPAELAGVPGADMDLRHEVYNLLPLEQIERLISILTLYLQPRNHGFLIRTDSGTAEPLYVNAWGGAWEGTILRTHWICDTSNPDCTWQYKNGMLISDSSNYGAPLAVMASGSQLVLTSQCTPSIDECVWFYDNGYWTTRSGVGVGLLDGPVTGSRVGFGTTSVKWSMANVMFTPSDLSPASLPAVYAMRATGQNGTGDAEEAGQVILDATCHPNDQNCTWTIKQGLILNDKNPSLGLNAENGAGSGLLAVTSLCDTSNVWNADCRWALGNNRIKTDNGDEFISYSLSTGNHVLTLPQPCTGPYCFLVSGNFAITRAGD